MAVTYQSITTQTVATGTTCVVTKPTGLAVGDLMVAIGVSYRGAAGTNVTLPSGFTSVHSQNAEFTRYNMGYKVADAGNVAASNFTFSVGASVDRFVCHLIRITTNGSFPSNPVVSEDNATDNNTSTNPTFTISASATLNAIAIATFMRQRNTTSVSNYVSSPTSLTWTERYDNSTSDFSAAIATAPISTAGPLSSFEVDTIISENNNYFSLLVVSDIQNATADISHLAVTPTVEGVTASQVNVATDVGYLAVTPTVNGISTQDSSIGQVWTPIDKS